MRLGVDLSTYFDERKHGAQYFYRGQEVDPLLAFKANGVDSLRIRVWVNPFDEKGVSYEGGGCDLASFLRLGRRATAFGYKIIIDLHYSDFWCDPGKQRKPKGWEGLTLDELAQKVYEYTRQVVFAAHYEGIAVEGVQIGNEITNGLLWPTGHLEGEVPHRTNYESVAALLLAGSKAVREVLPQTKIILHLEKSSDQATYHEFFDHMKALGVDYQVIGMSYYPYWHGSMDAFFANLDSLSVYGKEIQVVELGYAFTLKDYLKGAKAEDGQLVVNERSLEELHAPREYPYTEEGQASFVRDFLLKAKAHGVSCVYYWEPCWIPAKGTQWASEAGQRYLGQTVKETRNEWSNQCLFDYDGKATRAFDEFVIH